MAVGLSAGLGGADIVNVNSDRHKMEYLVTSLLYFSHIPSRDGYKP
jgi:hypothetical protein